MVGVEVTGDGVEVMGGRLTTGEEEEPEDGEEDEEPEDGEEDEEPEDGEEDDEPEDGEEDEPEEGEP